MNEKELLATMLAAAAMLEDEKNKVTKLGKSTRENARELEKTIKEAMNGLMDVGFTKEEAFKIMLTVKGGK
jgi:Holliday junction resolvasome RuvABC DNA-binding subunit